jgi:exonuclease III
MLETRPNMASYYAHKTVWLAWLKAAKPDIICLQELKCTDAEFPASVERVVSCSIIR